MVQFNEKIFTYHEAMPGYSTRLPVSLTFTNPSHEAILFKLLLGTIDLEYNYNGKKIKQRMNYSKLGAPINSRLGLNLFKDPDLDIINNKENADDYFTKNRRNHDVYRGILIEFSNYFLQQSKESYLAGFVHLYRCLEFISYSFPLIYASKSKDYKGTYKALKSFFSEEQKTELKFFKSFQSELIDKNVLKLPLDIDIEAPDTIMKDEYNSLIMNLCKGLDPTENGGIITIQYKHFFDFILRLRNRYFHLLSGTDQQNIRSDEIIVENLFKGINDLVANWISYIYFEICKFGIENS